MKSDFDGSWVAVMVRVSHERKVAEQLSVNGYECFLPLQPRTFLKIPEKDEPLFPGYLFCRYKTQCTLRIVQIPSVLSIVSFCNIPAVISEEEILSIFKIVSSQFFTESWTFPQEGQKVRIDSGPLEGVEGIFVSGTDSSKVVVNVGVLQRSIAVTVFDSNLIPV